MPESTCKMVHTEPFDFASCETHDTTFALGETCKFDGREMWEVFGEEASEQRQRAVRVEHEFQQMLARLRYPDPELLAKVACAIDHKHDEGAYRPVYGQSGECVDSAAARAAMLAIFRDVHGPDDDLA